MDAISVKEILTTVVLVAIIMLIYYMSYSEKRKQDKKIKEMQSNLKKGDKVITFSGLSGIISDIVEDRVIIETYPVKVSIEKWAVAGLDDRTIENKW